MPSTPSSNPAIAVMRVIVRAIATIVVVIWSVFDEVLFRPLRPVVAWLSRLRLFETIGGLIARTPPYGVLLLLAVPFVLIEPLKVVALYLIATGVFIRGVLLLIFSYVLSIFTLDRIYHTGHSQLMKIVWFARIMGWIGGIRDRAFGWVKATPAWLAAAATARAVRDWFRSLVNSAR
ncbi:MAG: hypothetical protein ABI398_02985 [Devosia sp.]